MQTHLEPGTLTRRPFLLPFRGPAFVRVCRSLDRPAVAHPTLGLLAPSALGRSQRGELAVWLSLILASIITVLLAFWS